MKTECVKTICPVCGPSNTTFVGECHDYPVVECDECSLMFVGECETVDETQDFFRTEHVGDSAETQEHYVDFRSNSLQKEANVVRRLCPDGGRLLDVGTASGCFLKNFANDSKWNVEGVEPSEVSARFAREQFGLNVRTGYLSEQHYNSDSFDVVTSLDAFNCHRTPNEDLAEIYRITKPGGCFAVEIPGQNYRMLTGSGLACRLLFGRSLRLNAGVNFFFYTTEALVKMASRAGFELVESYPEAMPRCGNVVSQAMKMAYSSASAVAYRVTSGRFHYAPKELLVFRKPAT